MNDGLDSGSVHERGYSDFMPGITVSPVFVEVTEISTQAAIFKKNSGFKTPSFPGKVVNCLHGHPTVMGLTEESARGCLFQIWKRGAPKMAPRRLKQGRSQKGTTKNCSCYQYSTSAISYENRTQRIVVFVIQKFVLTAFVLKGSYCKACQLSPEVHDRLREV